MLFEEISRDTMEKLDGQCKLFDAKTIVLAIELILLEAPG
jgi:hypothetical protein